MKIDSLLDLNAKLAAFTDEGQRIEGRISDPGTEVGFSFVPDQPVELASGLLLKLSDGNDAVMVRVVRPESGAYRLCIECYALDGHERRQDVRINDKLYLSLKFLGPAAERETLLLDSRLRTQATRHLQEAFLKGCYGYPVGAAESSSGHDRALWEINRKLDLLINMNLSDDFRQLMQSSPRSVNISAAGLRMVSEQSFDEGDIIEIGLILPQVPPLYVRTAGTVLRAKPVTLGGRQRYAVAVQFLDLSEENREDIIRYLFKRQREELRLRPHGRRQA